MYVWVIYDIRKNKTRTRIAKRCKYYGLQRVQKSVFLGKMKAKWLKALFQDMTRMVNQRTDRLFILRLSTAQMERALQTGAAPDLKQYIDEKTVKFFN